MTVNYEIPIVSFLGTGSQTVFDFAWTYEEATDIVVEVGGIRKVEGAEYELEGDPGEGGTVTFYEPPKQGDRVFIWRKTPITQQINYVEGDRFPAETHERQLDKDTRILQEIVEAGRALDGPVDLKAVPYKDRVDIENNRGNDATLPLWDCQDDFAGVFSGVVVESGAPQSNSPVDAPDGFIWFELTEAEGTDDRLVMTSTPLNVRVEKVADGSRYYALFYILWRDGRAIWGDSLTTQGDELLIVPNATGRGQYWVRMDAVSGVVAVGFGGSDEVELNGWFDYWQPDGLGYYGVYTTADIPSGTAEFGGSIDVTIAPDDGAGAPDTSKAITKRVTITLAFV